MNHTPTPWRLDPFGSICGWYEGQEVQLAVTSRTTFCGDEAWKDPGLRKSTEGNGAHIVHCVNSHDALLKAGDTFLEALAHVTGIEDARRAFIAALDAAERGPA